MRKFIENLKWITFSLLATACFAVIVYTPPKKAEAAQAAATVQRVYTLPAGLYPDGCLNAVGSPTVVCAYSSVTPSSREAYVVLPSIPGVYIVQRASRR